MGKDFNIVEYKNNRLERPPKKLSTNKEDGWDMLILKPGLEDT